MFVVPTCNRIAAKSRQRPQSQMTSSEITRERRLPPARGRCPSPPVAAAAPAAVATAIATAIATATAPATAPAGSATETETAVLMRAVSAGCRVSFAQLYELTSSRLFAIVRRIHKDNADAEDVLQETYIKIWDRSAQFDATRGEAVHWMGSIAHFSAIDHLRRASVRPHSRNARPTVEDEPYAGLACPQPQPQDHAMRAEETRAVQEQLRMLTTDQRESLTLAFYDGLSQQEISARLGRPLGTVKSWMRRAFSNLRQPLQAHQNLLGTLPAIRDQACQTP